MNKVKFLPYLIFIVVFANCNSVKKYNKTVNSNHSVKELHQDIDFAFKKINRLHPSLHWFITKEQLQHKIDSVKNSITEPMTSKEFYFVMSPLISEIRQGHNAVMYPGDRMEKDEYEKKYKDTKNDFYKLEFESIEDKVIIGEIYDSTKGLLYAELLKIDTFEVQELLDKYNYLRSSDGFNTTFYERRGGLFLKSYYRIENPRMDSVTLTLKQNGIIFDTTFYRVKDTAKINQRKREKEKDKSKEIDEDLTKEEIQKRLRKKKKEDKEKVKKGYSEFTKQYTRDYKFMKDSSVGYLKIRGFMGGPYEGLYDEFFEELDSAGTETLIIDLRDNLGGRLAEIHYLMKYLAKEKFTSIQPMESKTATPRTNALWSSNNGPLLILIKSIFTPFMYGYERATSKKKNGIYYHNMGSTKPGEPFENNFKGNIYVIVNGNSFSASSILSTNLQGSERATIVGEETGGTYNGTVAGMFKPVKLPNTKIMMQFGLGMIRAPYTEDPDGFGVIPDYTILPTIDHRKKGIDTELEWILKKVKEDKAKAELEEKNKEEEVDEEIEEVEEDENIEK